MIKKISALVLAGAMALSLAACGAEDKAAPPRAWAPPVLTPMASWPGWMS